MTYEMLAGALPFPVATTVDYQGAVLAGRSTPIGTHLPDAGDRLDAFFLAAFATDAARRAARASAFVTDLERALG
jgi:hypothetical protein